MNLKTIRVGLLACALFGIGWGAALAQPIRIAIIEPLSGPLAAVGGDILDAVKFTVDEINKRGGVLGGRKFEIVPMDNMMKAEVTLQQLKKAIDDGIQFVGQGAGSNHALNIIKQLEKHNQRNPENRVLYLNTAAVTTAFTNELCTFWHFRFDANVDMKVAGLATQMSRDESIKKVYLLNQNYAFGKSVQAAANKMINARTRAKVVGDDLIVPFGKTQDFTPYVAKIKASGADTVLTGNWGVDLTRLVKAVAEAGLHVQFFTFYGGVPSSVFGYGLENGVKVRIKQIIENNVNDEPRADVRAFSEAYEKVQKSTWTTDHYRFAYEMLAKAIEKAGSAKPLAVARALEGLTYPGTKGDMVMRAADHQILFPMAITSIDPGAKIKNIYKGQETGVGWKTDGWVTTEELTLPTTCKMNRPSN